MPRTLRRTSVRVSSTSSVCQQNSSHPSGISRSPLARFNLLWLPLELRQHIYTYVLPSNKPRNDISDDGWISGSVTILRANHQVYAEAIAVLFANVTFHIRVEQDCVLFIKTYHFLDGRILKVPLSVRYAFPETLGRNLWRVQRVAIQVKIGIMNVGGFVVNAGTQPIAREQLNAYEGQMQMLCVTLRKRVERIRLLHIAVPRSPPPGYLYILAPVGGLLNVDTVSWEGDVAEDIKVAAARMIQNSWARGSFLRLPPEVREKVYESLLPCHRTLMFSSQTELPLMQSIHHDHLSPLREFRGYTAILRTCKRVHEEARRILYAKNTFRIPVLNLKDVSRFHRLQAGLVGIGVCNFRLIRRFEITMPGGPEPCEWWMDAFTRLVQSNPQITAVTCRQEHWIIQDSTTMEVPQESVLGKKGLRHILFASVPAGWLLCDCASVIGQSYSSLSQRTARAPFRQIHLARHVTSKRATPTPTTPNRYNPSLNPSTLTPCYTTPSLEMEVPRLPDTDELPQRDETDSRYVLSQMSARKTHSTKQGVPLQYEYVKVSKGGIDKNQEGWKKPSKKVRTRGTKAKSSFPEVGRDENFFGALASDGDEADSEPEQAGSSVVAQNARSELKDECGLQANQNPENSRPSQARSPVAKEDQPPRLGNIGSVEATQDPSGGNHSARDQDIWNPVDFSKAILGSTFKGTKNSPTSEDRLQRGTPEPESDLSEPNSAQDGEGDGWETTDSEQDSDDAGEGNKSIDTATTKNQVDTAGQVSDDNGEGDDCTDSVLTQTGQSERLLPLAMLEVGESAPKLSEPEVGAEQGATTKKKKKKRNRKPRKKMEVDDEIPEFTSTYIADLTSRHRFVDPEGLSLAPEATLYHLDNSSEGTVSRSQIVALTLNECCVTAGTGEVWWVPPHIAKVRGHTDLIYTDKAWSKKEQQIFWKKTPLARMLAAKQSYLARKPRTDVISITLAFEDKAVLRWPKGSTAAVLLWYGLVDTGEIAFMWGIQRLRPFAEIEAEECVVHWSHLPEEVRKDWVLSSHDSTSDLLRHMMVACRNVSTRQASEAIVKGKNKLAQWKIMARPGSSTSKEKLGPSVRAADEQTQSVATEEMERTRTEIFSTRNAETQKPEFGTPLVPTADWFMPKLDVGFAVSSRMKDKAFRTDNLPPEDTEILTEPIQLSSRSRIIRPAVSRASRPKARIDVSQNIDQPSWSASFLKAGAQAYPSSDPGPTPSKSAANTNAENPPPSI